MGNSLARRIKSSTAVAILMLLVAVRPCPLVAQNPAKAHRKVLVMVEPRYPEVLKDGHFEGNIRLEATVLANGNVSKVVSLGGNPMLSQFAADAVMRWKYAPAATETVEEVSFHFNAKSQ